MSGYELAIALALFAAAAPAGSDGDRLRAELGAHYPSLSYVDRYRRAFPLEVQGSDGLWRGASPPVIGNRNDLVQSLVGLADQHVALTGPKSEPTETLGVLFRTASDGSMIVWRVFDPSNAPVRAGEQIIAIDGVPTAQWLEKAQAVTFGGNRRSRSAEAALNLGAGSRAAHGTLGIAASVSLTLQDQDKVVRRIVLSYADANDDTAAAIANAVNVPDLPDQFVSQGERVGTLRLGSFAPQYDKVFNDANKAASAHGESDDDAMVSGFCAVIRRFAASADAVATHSDVLVLDLRGNMGGFGREARLFAEALAPRSLPRSFDVFNTGKPGTVTLKEEPNDSPCGHIRATLPLIVLTDAGTRSAGELMAAWLWAAGALVAGERTIGAGGRFEYGSSGIVLPATGYGVRFSGNFTLFDPAAALKNGEMPESEMVDTVAAGDFAPSRQHYFAIQAAGMKPDLAVTTTIGDLRDGGVSEVGRILAVWKTSRGEKSTSP